MWDWINANKEWLFSGIGVVIILALGRLIFYFRKPIRGPEPATASALSSERQPSRSKQPLDYELLPLSFEILLNQEIPQIEIWFYIINFLPRELILTSVQVNQFSLAGGPTLDNIPAGNEVHIPARQWQQLLCRRPLVDSEIRAIDRIQQKNRCNATVIVTSRGSVGGKSIPYSSLSPRALNGWIMGIPPLPPYIAPLAR